MGFKFEDFIIWKNAMKLGEDINFITKKFPKHERFNLTSQIMRAVDSIALNISEGSIGQSKPEFRRFLGYVIRSLAEAVTCLHKSRLRHYISEEDFSILYKDSYDLMNMMVAFKKRV